MVRFRWVRALLPGLLAMWVPVHASAQSCALCYTQAASAGQRVIEALRSGILILIIPPTLMTIGVFFVVYRKQYDYRPPEESQPDRTW